MSDDKKDLAVPEVVEVDAAEMKAVRELQRTEELHQKRMHALSPVELLAQAMDRGLDADTLEKFMDLSERHEANEARKAFADDKANCEVEMQPVVAAAENDHTTSYYAKLGVINQQIKPIYGKHGFSVSFGSGTATTEGEIRVTARLLHRMGHYEDYDLDLPPDLAGKDGNANKTPIHARISSTTYGRREIIKGIFNISILSEDDDGNAAGGSVSNITEEQAIELQTMCDQGGLKASIVAREFGKQEIAILKAKDFDKAKARIEQLIKARSNRK
ncbi:MAG: ERF family protein [Pseudohongiellaceae bacterium]